MNGKIFGSTLSLSKIIGGLSKGLNIVNQAIPLYTQLKPILSNAGGILNVFKEMSSDKVEKQSVNDTSNINIIEQQFNVKKEKKVSNNLPTFFQ